MPILVERLGPGVLTLGAGLLAVQQQLTSCTLTPAESVDTEDGLKVLSGEALADNDTLTFNYTLTGEFLQTLVAGGVVAWSWTNKGVASAFSFKPNGSAATIVGQLLPVPLAVGGTEVGKRMTSSFTWRVVGTPTPTWS